MAAYDQYLSGSLIDFEVTDEEVQRNLDKIEKLV
jgi:tryptophan synthase beta chain